MPRKERERQGSLRSSVYDLVSYQAEGGGFLGKKIQSLIKDQLFIYLFNMV